MRDFARHVGSSHQVPTNTRVVKDGGADSSPTPPKRCRIAALLVSITQGRRRIADTARPLAHTYVTDAAGSDHGARPRCEIQRHGEDSKKQPGVARALRLNTYY
ncbi:hypothetical protein CIB48_g10443 [Xylaria polymorpha]|nr:hypothetical protein CIB48_g10443 [Xylaria polymorpha]